MKLRSLALASLVVLAPMVAQTAAAQTKVLVIDEALVKRDSKIGKDIIAKLGAARDEGVTKLGLQKLEAEIKAEEAALAPQTKSLTKEALNANPTLKAKLEALNKKKVEFAQKAQALNAGLDQSSGNAEVAFQIALAPAVAFVAEQQKADIVVSAGTLWYVKPTADISKQVVARLDATTPTLESLKAAQEAAKPAAAAAPKK